MAYFHECPMCGARLDPGEKCDCEEVRSYAKTADKANTAAASIYSAMAENSVSGFRRGGGVGEYMQLSLLH